MRRRRGRRERRRRSRSARIAATSPGPAPSTRIAANGSAVRVTSEPKIETRCGAEDPDEVAVAPDRAGHAADSGTDAAAVADAGDLESRRPEIVRLHCPRLGASEPAHHPDRAVPVAARAGQLSTTEPYPNRVRQPERTPSQDPRRPDRPRPRQRGGRRRRDARDPALACSRPTSTSRSSRTSSPASASRPSAREVLQSLNAGQQVVKIVNDELVALLGAGDRTFHLQGNPAVIALVGLQGSGKTTSAGEARAVPRQAGPPAAARRRGPVSPGRRRPARDARHDRSTSRSTGRRSGRRSSTSPRGGLEAARRLVRDVVILDTAGRLTIDEELMARDRRRQRRGEAGRDAARRRRDDRPGGRRPSPRRSRTPSR